MKTNRTIKYLNYLALASAIWMSNPASLFALDSTWNVDTGGDWTNAINWTAGVPNAPSDIANLTYNLSGTARRDVNLRTNITVGMLNIGDPDGTASFMPTPSAWTLTFDNGGSGASLVKAAGLTTGTGDQIDCKVALADTLTISNNASMTLTFWQAISGSASYPLIKAGAGLVSLRGNSTYAGGTLIREGALQAGSGTALNGNEFGTGVVTNRALLNFNPNGAGNTSFPNSFVFDGGTNNNVDGIIRLGTGVGATITVASPSLVQRTWGRVTGKQLSLNGILQGTAALTLQNTGGNAGEGSSIWINNPSNTYSGTVTANANSGSAGFVMVVGTNLALQYATVNLQGTRPGGSTDASMLYGIQFSAGATSPLLGALGGSGNIALTNLTGASVALTVGSNNASTTFSGVLSGSGSLTKVGNGSMTLSGANSYSGTTLVNAGKLSISAASTIANTITVADGTAFGVIGAGASQLAPSTLTLGSSTGVTNEFSGLTSTTIAPLKPGTLTAGGNCKISIVSGSFVLGSSYPLITNIGAASFTLVSQPPGVSGNLSTSGNTLYYNVTSVTPKIWTGATDANWDLTTTNWSFNSVAGIYQNDNIVLFDDTGANTAITVPSAVSPGSVTVSNSSQSYSFSGSAISGAASLTKNGNGTLSLANTNTFTGGAVVNGGTLSVDAANAYSGGTVVNSSSTLNLNVGGQMGAIRGALTVSSGGYANLVAQNSLGWGAGTRVETVNVNGGLLETTATGDANWNTTFNLTGGELRANGGSSSAASASYITLGRDSSGACGVNTLASTSNSVVSGRLQLRNDQGQTNVTFNIADGSAAVDLLVSAAITYNAGTVGITKTGAGTMELSGANTYSGATFVNAGKLVVSGTLGSGALIVTNATLGGNGTIGGPTTLSDYATLAPGTNDIGTLTINNSLTMAAGSTNNIKLAKSGSTLTNDAIAGLTTVAYSGILNVSASGDPLTAGDSFQIFKASSSYSGSFSATNLPATAAGTKWNLSALNVSGTISVMLTNAVSTPVFSPPAGGYVGAQQITISSDSGSTIYYTTDGSTPTTSSPSGLSPVLVNIPVNTNMTLKAFAKKATYGDSGVGSASYVTMDRGIWINAGGGSWPVTGNWSNGVVASGSGVTADFSLTVSADTTNTLDGDRTIGTILFPDLQDIWFWRLAGPGILTMDASNSTPVMFVSNSIVTVAAQVAGTNGLLKTGAGNLTLANNASTFSGNLTVSNGTLTASVGTSSANTNSCLGLKVGGRSIVIASGARANWTVNNVLGGGGLNATNLPTLVVVGTNDATRWNPLGDVVLNGGTLNQSVTDSGNYEGWQLLGMVSVTGSAPSYITTGNGKADHLLSTGNTFDVADVTGNADSDLIISAPLRSSSGDYPPTTSGSLFKIGAGTLELATANTYVGSTVVSNGTLLVSSSGSIASGGTVTVSGGTLTGNGTISSPVTVQAGGNLQPGTTSIGSLTVSGAALTLGGNASFRISKNGGTPTGDQLAGSSVVNYGGTLTVTNITTDSTPLASGDSFQLFPATSYGVTLFTNYVLPTLTAGLSWDKSQLTVNGTISVVNTTATPLFSPAAGAYFSVLTVTMTGDTGSTIHYSTNGGATWQTGASPVSYNIPMNANITLTAYASKSGYSDSAQVSATYTTQPEAVWNNTSGGSWATAGNWLNTAIGNGSGVTANFTTLTLPGETTVTLDSAPTIGHLNFADQGGANNWVIASGIGGPLTLDAGAIVPSITVSNMTTTISSVLTGTNGLVKAGAGTLTLAGTNTFTGGTVVSNGNLALAAGGASGTVRGTLTVNSGATVNCTAVDALGYSVGVCATPINVSGGTLDNSTSGNQAFRSSFNLTGGTVSSTGGGSYNFTTGQSISSLASSTLSSFSAAIQLRDGATLTFDTAAGSVPGGMDFSMSGVIFQNGPAAGITKTGAGMLALGGANTYTGATTVSNGTLLVNGSLGGTPVTVVGGTLGGTGAISGPVTLNSGTVLSPGASVGTLTINSDLNFAGNLFIELDKSLAATNDYVVVSGGLTNTGSGTLTLTNEGPALAAGDTFKLFSKPVVGGQLLTLSPALTGGLAWTNNLAVDGTVAVIAVSVAPSPAHLTNTVSGGVLGLSWPAGQGWKLQVQTNSRSVGLKTNWFDVAGSTSLSSTNITIDKTQPTVFYRLVYP